MATATKPTTTPYNREADSLSPLEADNRCFEDTLKGRSSYELSWKDVARYTQPTLPRFTQDDSNRGDRTNTKILDDTATRAGEITTAGLLAGVASPARPWAELGLGLGDEIPAGSDVERWLVACRDRVLALYDRSNFYTELGDLLRGMTFFGTGAFAMFEHPTQVIRCQGMPIGSYALAMGDDGVVHTCARDLTLTVGQVVRRYGLESCSEKVQTDYRNHRYETPVTVRHLIKPNDEADARKAQYDNRYLPWKESTWEAGRKQPRGRSASGEGGDYLQQGGYRSFPVIVGRWHRNAEDVYGTSCPALMCLGRIKMLQSMQRKLLNGLEKMVDPPLTGGNTYKNRVVSTLAGEVTLGDPVTQQQRLGPMYEVRLPLQELQAKIAEEQNAVNDAFLTKLFLRWTLDERPQPPTAAQVYAQEKEKLIIGPLHERIADEVLDRCIARTLEIMIRRSMPAWRLGIEDALLPAPPEGVDLRKLRVEYISEFAISQRQVGLTGLERALVFLGQQAQLYGPTALDVYDPDKAFELYGDQVGLDPRVMRSPEETADIREQRAQQQAAMQQAATVPAAAETAKTLSETKLGSDSVLDKLLLAGGRTPT